MNYRPPLDLRNHIRSVMADNSVSDWFLHTHGPVGVSDTLIASTDVLALNATAIEVVPAPGEGRYLEFLGGLVLLKYNSTAYVADAGEDLVFTLEDKSGDPVSNSMDGTLFTGTADALAMAYPLGAAASTVPLVANEPLCLWRETGEWITGNSPLAVRVFYRVHDLRDLKAIR